MRLDAAELAERHGLAIAGAHGDVWKRLQTGAQIPSCPPDDVDQVGAFAILADDEPAVMSLQRLRDAFARDAERSRLLLIKRERHGGNALVPVVVDVERLRISPHDLCDPVGERAHPRRVVTGDPEYQRIFERRADRQPVHAPAEFRELREALAQPAAHTLSRRVVLRHDDDLGEVGIGELLCDEQEEARRACPDVRGVVEHVLVLGKQCFDLLRRRLRLRETRAFGQPQVDQQLRPVRLGEELLGHLGECQPAGNKKEDRRRDDEHAALDRPVHRPPQPAVERCRIRFVRRAVRLEQAEAEERREQDRADPGQQNGDRYDLEYAQRVFPR